MDDPFTRYRGGTGGGLEGAISLRKNKIAPLSEGENHFSEIFGSECTPKTVF